MNSLAISMDAQTLIFLILMATIVFIGLPVSLSMWRDRRREAAARREKL